MLFRYVFVVARRFLVLMAILEGKYPVNAVRMISRICAQAEQDLDYRVLYQRLWAHVIPPISVSESGLFLGLLCSAVVSPVLLWQALRHTLRSHFFFLLCNFNLYFQFFSFGITCAKALQTTFDLISSLIPTVASSAVKSASDVRATLIIGLSATGNTVRLISKFRPPTIILCVTDNPLTAQRVLLHRGTWSLVYRFVCALSINPPYKFCRSQITLN